MIPLLPFGEDGHMGCISCSVKLKGSVYFTLYLHAAHVPGVVSASLLQHWSCYKKLVLECFTPVVPKAQWSAARGLSVFGSKHKRL